MYAELGFVRPDGSIHRALAFVDMGTPSMVVAESLLKELQVDANRPLVFRVGTLQIEIPALTVISQTPGAEVDGIVGAIPTPVGDQTTPNHALSIRAARVPQVDDRSTREVGQKLLLTDFEPGIFFPPADRG